MPNSLYRKGLVVGIIVLFVGGSISSITGIENKSIAQISSDFYQNIDDCVINITVYEAWELLNDISNGIQIPIDIRSDEQWNEYFIDTPYPENPVHCNENDTDFFSKYAGKEIMIYCEGGYRSLILSYLLCENFTGIIYHWDGGIIEWIEAGLPIRNNTAPEAPTVKGKVMIHEPGPYNYKFTATDPENDYVRYFIDWGDGNWEWTDYNASGEQIIVSHIWNAAGTAMVISRANDTYGALGPEGYLEWSKIDKNEIITDDEEDCLDCQSNGKTHLAEKIFNRLEKNEVLSNVINLDTQGDRPICNMLNDTIQRLWKLTDSLEGYLLSIPDDTVYWKVVALTLYRIYSFIGILEGTGIKLHCGDY